MPDYLPHQDGALNSFEDTFKLQLPVAASKLGIPAEEINPVIQVITDHQAAFADMNVKKKASNSAVEKNAAAKAFSVSEIRRMAQRLKSTNGYTDEIGKELGIVGNDGTAVDLTSIKPTLKYNIVGGTVVITFNKQHMDGVKIYSKRSGESEFTFLAIDRASPYEDNRPKINSAMPEERHYYAYYFYSDQQVGQQSDILTVIAP